MVTGIVILCSLPVEQFVITAFPPTTHRDQISNETEIAPRHSEPPASYLLLPTETGRVPHPSIVNNAILL
jgi:hypothetical protein